MTSFFLWLQEQQHRRDDAGEVARVVTGAPRAEAFQRDPGCTS